MAKKIELLLLRSVESLGIVGDIVKVRPGHARNFLLPLELAEHPTPSKIESLKEARAAAQAELSALRSAREALLTRMQDVKVTMKRSCNDQGVLYGSVNQRDISDALQAAGYDVSVRSVRLSTAIGRIGTYDVPLQFEKDLRTTIGVVIEPDRTLDEGEPEMEIDEEGNLVQPPKDGEGRGRGRRPRKGEAEAEGAAESPAASEEKPARTDKPAKADKPAKVRKPKAQPAAAVPNP